MTALLAVDLSSTDYALRSAGGRVNGGVVRFKADRLEADAIALSGRAIAQAPEHAR